ncbi:MAG: hypothetical protein WDA20_13040 [Desulfuromonadales bacterium]
MHNFIDRLLGVRPIFPATATIRGITVPQLTERQLAVEIHRNQQFIVCPGLSPAINPSKNQKTAGTITAPDGR